MRQIARILFDGEINDLNSLDEALELGVVKADFGVRSSIIAG
jgi:hypothetical protein